MTIPNTIDVLEQASSEDLGPLVEYILKASTTESLSKTDAYKEYSPDHHRYPREILKEIRAFGGNTYANLFRGGHGPDYFEVVCDVAGKFKIKKPEQYNLLDLEEAIIEKILKDALNNARGKERAGMESALKEAGLNREGVDALLSGRSLNTIIGAGMAGVVAYQIARIIADTVARQVLGHGLRMATNATLTRGLAVFAGPIGWIVSGLWTAVDIAGPAYRVTVPCAIHIAMLRRRAICQAEGTERNPFHDD